MLLILHIIGSVSFKLLGVFQQQRCCHLERNGPLAKILRRLSSVIDLLFNRVASEA
jgi:hypothetical protein